MTDDLINYAYEVLKEQRCINCNFPYEFQNLRLTKQDDQIAEEYICPDCNQSQNIVIEFEGWVAELRIYGPDNNVKNITHISKMAIESRRHPVSDITDAYFELVNASQILRTNYDQIEELEDEMPKYFQKKLNKNILELDEVTSDGPVNFNLGTSSDWVFAQAFFHNFLASAYSFDQALESVRENIEWGSELETQFRDYKNSTDVVLGIRHFAQHHSTLPIQFYLSEDDPHRTIHFTIDLAYLEEYDFKEGFEYHFGEIEGDSIDISVEFAKYLHDALELTLKIGEYGLEKRGDEIEEYEQLHENVPGVDEWEFTDPFNNDSSTENKKSNPALELAKIAPSPMELFIEGQPVNFQPEIVNITDEGVRCLAQGVFRGQLTFVRLQGEFGDSSLSFEVLKNNQRSSILSELNNSDKSFRKIGTVSDLSLDSSV